MTTDEPIALNCADCGQLMGYLVLARLPRAMRATLRIMADTFGGEEKIGEAKATGGIPLVCATCNGDWRGT